MTEAELLSLLESEEANCISSQTGLLAEQRRKALAYYNGQPYGNEVEGRSQVVTTEVKDAVEEILPALMKVFSSSDETVRFDPQGPEDEAIAQQATDYINYIFSRVNNGFQSLYCLFKDALLLKNGYVKVYWEDYEDVQKETYEGLNDLEFQSISQDQDLELVEHTPGPGTHDAVFRRAKKYGKICIDPIPPDEVLIARETPNDLKKAQFVEHRTQKTISQVRSMGYDVEDDIADFTTADYNMERVERLKFDDALGDQRDDSPDPASRKVWLCEAYLFVDFDGDGIAEYRKVTKIGKTILDNVEFDSLPIIGGAVIPMPHKHYGMSIYDLVGDIQLIKSTVTRQLLDNAYNANNGEYEVLDGMANMDDLLTSRPNGIKRVKVLGAIKRIDKPMIGNSFYNLLEYFDKVKQNRTGVVDFGEWTDPNILNAKATTAEITRSATQQRIELMARILAEGPVKDIFWKIMELVSKHQQKPQVVRLRGKWTEVDPRQWHKKFDMTVTVGLGTGSQQMTLNGAMGIMQIQSGMQQSGLGGRVVTESNIYHAARKYAKAVFPRDADMMFTDPSTMPPPQPQPNPDLLKIELARYKAEMGDAQKRDKMQQDGVLEQMRQQLESDKVQFQAMVDSAMKDKDHESDIAKQVLDMANQQRQFMMEKIAELRLHADEDMVEKENIVLQGKIDSLIESQKQQAELIKEMVRLQAAERENEVTERDQKGKVKKTVSRVKQ